MLGNRKQTRALNAKIKRMSGDEVELIINQFMRDVYSMTLINRLKFCFNLIIRKRQGKK